MVGAVLWGLDDRNAKPQGEINEVSRSEPATLSLRPALVQSGVVMNQPVSQAPVPATVRAAIQAEVAEIPRIRPVARPSNLVPQPQPAPKPVQEASLADQARAALAPRTVAPAPAPAPVQASPAATSLVDQVKAALAPKPAAPAPQPVAKAPVQAAPVQQAPVVAAKPAKRDITNDAVATMSYGIIGAFQAEPTQKPATPTLRPQARVPALANQQTAKLEPATPPMRTYTVKEGDSLPGIAFRFYGTTVAYLQIINANQDVLANPSDLRAGMTLRIPETE